MKNRVFLLMSIFEMIVFLCLSGCVKDRNFEIPQNSCATSLVANATFSEVKNLYLDETIQIQDDLIIEGYVISSDKAGNFFSVLHFQDKATDPSEGFQIAIDVRDSHLFYPIGSKILIKLKGLYLGKSKDVFKIGGVFTSFGNLSVGRLPSAVVNDHIIVSCDDVTDIRPRVIELAELEEDLTNTLVQLGNVEVLIEELGQTFAIELEETERTLTDCQNAEITLLNSGYADFQSVLLPEGNGTIKGVLMRENDAYHLVIRDLEDIDFAGERCEEVVDALTSKNIFISELADPDNNTEARFVELYNSSSEKVSLNGWVLRRYTNSNTEVGSTIDLSDFEIEGEDTFVISPNALEFESVYGFAPDMGVGGNSPADSNGDDNLELVDPFGNVIDAFGVVGEDGSGTNHEFEDGRALRKSDVQEGNPAYTFGEWTICNDTGGSGTIDATKNAPNDFTPGIRD